MQFSRHGGVVVVISVVEDSRKRKCNVPSDSCCFGDILKEECHKEHFKNTIANFESLSRDDQIFQKWRDKISMSDTSVTTIFDYQIYKFGDKFVSSFINANVCGNIFSKHRRSKKKVIGGHVITLDMAMKLNNEGKEATPGWKFVEAVMIKS